MSCFTAQCLAAFAIGILLSFSTIHKILIGCSFSGQSDFDCVCRHITQHLLLPMGIYLVGDGNDIRQQFGEVQLMIAPLHPSIRDCSGLRPYVLVC